MLHTGPHGCGVSHSIDGRTGPQYQLSNCQCEDTSKGNPKRNYLEIISMTQCLSKYTKNKIRRTPFFCSHTVYVSNESPAFFQLIILLPSPRHEDTLANNFNASSQRPFKPNSRILLAKINQKNSQTPSKPTNSKKTSKHLQFSNEKHHGKKPLKTHREKHDQKQRNPRIHQILWLVLEISFVLTWLLHNSTVNFWMTSLVFCFKCHLCHIICHRWNGDLILSRGSHFEPRTC